MTKQKIRKSALKRFRLTKKGKLLHRRQHGNHLKASKSKTQRRRLKKIVELKGKFKSKIKRMIGAS